MDKIIFAQLTQRSGLRDIQTSFSVGGSFDQTILALISRFWRGSLSEFIFENRYN